MSRTSKITLMPEWLRLLTDAVTDETGAEVSANTPTDARLAFQQGCYNGAHRLASRATPRVAALELFAKAFTGAFDEWRYESHKNDARTCAECGGAHPEDFDRAGSRERSSSPYFRNKREGVEAMGRGHRPDCLRGRAVAMLKDTA